MIHIVGRRHLRIIISPPAAAESCGGGQLSLCVAPLQQEGKPKNLDHLGDHHLNTVTVDGMDRCGIICCSLQGNEALSSSSVDTGYLSRGELSPGSPSCSSGWTRKRIIIMKWGGCWEIKFYTMVERKRTTWEKSLLRRHAAPKNETTSSTHQTKQTKVKRGDPISSIISVIRPARLILSLFSLSCFPSFLKSIQQNTFPLSLQILIFSCYYPSFPWL